MVHDSIITFTINPGINIHLLLQKHYRMIIISWIGSGNEPTVADKDWSYLDWDSSLKSIEKDHNQENEDGMIFFQWHKPELSKKNIS